MVNSNQLGRLLIGSIFVFGLLVLLPAGCPTSTGETTSAGDDTTSSTDSSGTTDSSPDDSSTTSTDSGAADDGTDTTSSGPSGDLSSGVTTGNSASGPPGTGALVVKTLTGAKNTYFDIYQLPADRSVQTYEESNVACSLAPGSYYVTQYYNSNFRYSPDLTITAGTTTTVTLGAIQLVTVENASDGYFDIYDSTGATEYASYNESNALITAPAGTFVLKEYFNANFDYATSVTVEPGATTTVQMGGIKLITVEDPADGTYGIYDGTGATVYATYNDPNVIITAPAGTFVLKEYFNPDFTYASNVTVVAGEVTEVRMGAIRFTGSITYDIYSGGSLVASCNDPKVNITAPAGTYTLTKYYDPDTVIQTNVVVTAGAVTTVP